MASFRHKGVTVKSGERYTLVLQHGATTREITGTVTSFKDEAGVVRWEISTESFDDYDHWKWPAIGFLTEDVSEIRPA